MRCPQSFPQTVEKFSGLLWKSQRESHDGFQRGKKSPSPDFVVKSCSRATTFFQKGLAFFRSLWYNSKVFISHLPVAQLDSASDSDSEGRRFESFRVGQEEKSHPADGWLFSVKFVPYGTSEIRPRRVKERILFRVLRSLFGEAGYFTVSVFSRPIAEWRGI